MFPDSGYSSRCSSICRSQVPSYEYEQTRYGSVACDLALKFFERQGILLQCYEQEKRFSWASTDLSGAHSCYATSCPPRATFLCKPGCSRIRSYQTYPHKHLGGILEALEARLAIMRHHELFLSNDGIAGMIHKASLHKYSLNVFVVLQLH